MHTWKHATDEVKTMVSGMESIFIHPLGFDTTQTIPAPLNATAIPLCRPLQYPVQRSSSLTNSQTPLYHSSPLQIYIVIRSHAQLAKLAFIPIPTQEEQPQPGSYPGIIITTSLPVVRSFLLEPKVVTSRPRSNENNLLCNE